MSRKKKSKFMKKLKALKNLPFKKLGIVALVLIIAMVIFNFRDAIFCSYPEIVMQYKMRYNQMANPEYLDQLRAFANGSLILAGTDQDGNSLELSLNDSLPGLNWSQLLDWEHRHLMYWGGELTVRPEMPIEILTTNILFTDGSFIALGRCGEFALLYNGLLLANGYQSRIVVDCSIKTDDRLAGDHVFNQVWINGSWLHVDPTERIINDPAMYADPNRWNKNVNLVYAIEGNKIIDVTKDFQYP